MIADSGDNTIASLVQSVKNKFMNVVSHLAKGD